MFNLLRTVVDTPNAIDTLRHPIFRHSESICRCTADDGFKCIRTWAYYRVTSAKKQVPLLKVLDVLVADIIMRIQAVRQIQKKLPSYGKSNADCSGEALYTVDDVA